MGVSDDGVDLSVVIAAYNAAATLPAQLAALAGQRATCTWEVVLADNGSHDGTVAVARAFAGRLPALRVVDASERRGAAAARNTGAQAARGRSLAFCDADDVVADGWVQSMFEALARHDFVAGRFDGARLNTPDVLASRVLPQSDGLQESALLPGLRHAGAGNMGVRADLFRRVGGFDEALRCLEDTDLCWRIQLSGVPLAYADEALVHVRLRAGLRSTVRQGFAYGAAERGLARRYANVAAGAATRPPQPAVAAEQQPGTAARLLRRVLGVGAGLARVRRRGELLALCWSTAWGLGFALGHGPEPEPVRLPPKESHAP
ncbi:glycosyltransferase family 2 protein [Cellulomonas timonensis]|uniref:glycosyltransferase family 2 protein n=1 Tax=Cellulomonas timonensis TaxID=1689271 RepID=UPI000A677CAE|nr:glycosyltransferase family A protein [Cellulomonas timonensis]